MHMSQYYPGELRVQKFLVPTKGLDLVPLRLPTGCLYARLQREGGESNQAPLRRPGDLRPLRGVDVLWRLHDAAIQDIYPKRHEYDEPSCNVPRPER